MSYAIGDTIEYNRVSHLPSEVAGSLLPRLHQGVLIKLIDGRARVQTKDGKTTWIKELDITKVISVAPVNANTAVTTVTTVTTATTAIDTTLFAPPPDILTFGSNAEWNQQAKYLLEFGATTLKNLWRSQLPKFSGSKGKAPSKTNPIRSSDYTTVLDLVMVIDTNPNNNHQESKLVGAACIDRPQWQDNGEEKTDLGWGTVSSPTEGPPQLTDTELQRMIDVCQSADMSIRMGSEQKFAFLLCAKEILNGQHFPSFLCRIIFNWAIEMDENWYSQGVNCGALGYSMFGYKMMIRSAPQGNGSVVLDASSLHYNKKPSRNVGTICSPFERARKTCNCVLYYIPHRQVCIANISFNGYPHLTDPGSLEMRNVMHAYIERLILSSSSFMPPCNDGATGSSKFAQSRCVFKEIKNKLRKHALKQLRKGGGQLSGQGTW